MFTLNPRDKANLLVMTSRPNEVRNVSADFDAPGLPYWSVVCRVLSEGARVTRLFYMGDFMQAWCAMRAVSRGFWRAADSMWWETCKQLVGHRVNTVMNDAFLTSRFPMVSSSSSEP